MNPRRRAILAVVLVLLAGLGFASLPWSRWFTPRLVDTNDLSSTESADPRRTYNGPYRNIHPDVAYVGDASCADCHDDISRSFVLHPMGRSLIPVQSLVDQQHYTPDTHNPFNALGRRFEVERRGQRMMHRQAVLERSGKPVVELSLEVQWVVGSGAKGYSYLFERDGFLFQTPISWFAQQRRWDLSPGFGPDVLTGRPLTAGCLFCHANRVREHPEQPDRFMDPVFEGQSIGCERCHGPGERHVQSVDRWDIVNPARLAPPLRDAVCEQCHLEGEARIVRGGRRLFDYRPGLPLNEFWAVLVHDRQNGEDTKAVNHVEQMYQSKCFSRPVGDQKLGCISCHDPHVAVGPAQRLTHYRAKCLQCHDGTKDPPVCSEPPARRKKASPADSCMDCHMPRYRSSDIVHTASTDHRIVRRPERPPASAPDPESGALVDFYRDRFPGGDPQTERTLGLGLVKLMSENMLQPQRHADRALRFLESALGRDPSDAAIREGKVEAYWQLRRPAESLSEAEALLPEQPVNWQLLIQAAYAAQAAGELERAREYWRRAVEINPYQPEYQVRLVSLLLRAGRLEEARKHCEQLLRLDPFNVSGRQAWVGFLLQEGKRDEARRAFDVIRQLRPSDLPERENWFEQQMR